MGFGGLEIGEGLFDVAHDGVTLGGGSRRENQTEIGYQLVGRFGTGLHHPVARQLEGNVDLAAETHGFGAA